jgi:hypothetical protein
MSSTDITKEVDELVHLAFRFINSNGKPTIEETVDCIRKAKSCFEDRDEVVAELSRTNFNKLNRVRDMFVKEYDLFNKNHLTKEWMYDLMDSITKTDDILEHGSYKRFIDYSKELIPLYTQRLYGITPNRAIGGGEYLIRMMFSMVDDVTIPSNTKGVSGDLKIRDTVYEVKGNQGKLDGAHVDELLKVISKYEEVNNGKGGQIMSHKHEGLVKDLLGCYFSGDNPYPIVAVDADGYVIIDDTLKWDGVNVGVVIPRWMKIKAFDKNSDLKFNDNERTIKLIMKKKA